MENRASAPHLSTSPLLLVSPSPCLHLTRSISAKTRASDSPRAQTPSLRSGTIVELTLFTTSAAKGQIYAIGGDPGSPNFGALSTVEAFDPKLSVDAAGKLTTLWGRLKAVR